MLEEPDEEPAVHHTYPAPRSGGEAAEIKALDVDAPPLFYAACLATGILMDIRQDTWAGLPEDVWRLLEHRGIVLTDEQYEMLEKYERALDYISRTHTVTEADGTKRKFKGVSLNVCWNHQKGWFPTTKAGGGCLESTVCKAKDISKATRLKPIEPLPNYRKPPDPNAPPKPPRKPRKKAAPKKEPSEPVTPQMNFEDES